MSTRTFSFPEVLPLTVYKKRYFKSWLHFLGGEFFVVLAVFTYLLDPWWLVYSVFVYSTYELGYVHNDLKARYGEDTVRETISIGSFCVKILLTFALGLAINARFPEVTLLIPLLAVFFIHNTVNMTKPLTILILKCMKLSVLAMPIYSNDIDWVLICFLPVPAILEYYGKKYPRFSDLYDIRNSKFVLIYYFALSLLTFMWTGEINAVVVFVVSYALTQSKRFLKHAL